MDCRSGPASRLSGQRPQSNHHGSDDAVKAPAGLNVTHSPDAIRIDTGGLRFAVKKHGFNLLDEVYIRKANGSEIPAVQQDAASGVTVTDHEGTVYRAANDGRVDGF